MAYRITYIAPGDRPELHKFISMGLMPGAELRVTQTLPVLVIEIQDTLLAKDAELARNIFVLNSTAVS